VVDALSTTVDKVPGVQVLNKSVAFINQKQKATWKAMSDNAASNGADFTSTATISTATHFLSSQGTRIALTEFGTAAAGNDASCGNFGFATAHAMVVARIQSQNLGRCFLVYEPHPKKMAMWNLKDLRPFGVSKLLRSLKATSRNGLNVWFVADPDPVQALDCRQRCLKFIKRTRWLDLAAHEDLFLRKDGTTWSQKIKFQLLM
jgi:hypothetical protein